MSHQPTSPNVFDQIYLSNQKEDNCSQSELCFNKKLQAIQQFIDLLQDNPSNLAQVTLVELRWERSFYKNQLKAALHLNYSLIKLHQQQNDELNVLKQQIQGLSKNKQLKRLQYNNQSSQNIQLFSNGGNPIKKKVMKKAFEAQKNIIQAKYKLQSDQLKKVLEHRECILKAYKQQNQYLRSQLIKMGEKHKNLSKINKDQDQKRKKLEEESQRLQMVIKQLQQNERRWKQQKRLNQLSCSPIRQSGQAFTIQEGEISFNHEFHQQNLLENKILKKQLQDLQTSLEKIKHQNQALLSRRQLKNNEVQHQEVLRQSRRMFLTSLQSQYLQLKQQLGVRVAEIQKCKKIIQQIKKSQSRHSCKLENECPNCNSLKKAFEALKVQNEQIQSKYFGLRQKLQKTLNLQLLQRKQWDAFLNDLKPE